MPTPKQVREAYKRVDFYIWRLQAALTHAHNIDVIQYDQLKYNELAPCRSLAELRDRVRASTEKALAQAMREEIRGWK
jgi:hypothetical protein